MNELVSGKLNTPLFNYLNPGDPALLFALPSYHARLFR